MSLGRVFHSLGPATANDRSPTVTSRDRGMTSSEEVDDRRRPLDVSLVPPLRSFHSIHNVVDRGVLQAMWEKLVGRVVEVGHRDHLIC